MLRQSLNGLKAAGTNFYGARAAVEGWKSKFFKRLSFYLDSGFSSALQIIFQQTWKKVKPKSWFQ